ncbi:dioxygenase [Halomonas sp. HK25]|uniref:dioxygenase family protein n=1 Tax=Halomonas sp. HK25 TaxID=3394321 RepID=UPI0039FC8DDD
MPLAITEPDDDTLLSHRDTVHEGERYHFCSDGCRDIFHHEPEKYVQAWLPVHQILQGNCGGADMEKVIGDYYRIEIGEDNLEFDVTEEEYWSTVSLLNALGSQTQFGLLSPGLGFDHYLDMRQDAADAEAKRTGGTPRTIEGPLYVAGAPTDVVLKSLGRHGERPAHIHYFISAPDHQHLTTQINLAGTAKV